MVSPLWKSGHPSSAYKLQPPWKMGVGESVSSGIHWEGSGARAALVPLGGAGARHYGSRVGGGGRGDSAAAGRGHGPC